MVEKVGNEKTPPPLIIIQASNPDNVNDTSNASTFPGAEGNYNNNKIIVPIEGKPDALLFGVALLMIGISTAAFFFGIDSDIGAGEFLCCLLCNGNGIGLLLLGVYSSKYGTWEKASGRNGSAVFSQIVAGLLICVAVAFFGLWMIFTSNF